MSNFADYLALPGVNWSSLKHMERSPLHYLHAKDATFEPTPAMELGSAAHVAVLEPDEFPRRYVLWEGEVRRGKAWDEFREANTGREILRTADYEAALAIRDAVRSNPVASPYLTGPGACEVTLQWVDRETGLAMKGRADRIAFDVRGKRVLVDMKTSAEIGPRRFGNSAARLGYHAQLALYADGLAAMGQPVDKVVILLVESKPPHDCGVLRLDPDEVLYAGEEHYRLLLRRLAECRKNDHWPGQYPNETTLDLPAWVFPGDDDPTMGLNVEGVSHERSERR